MPRRPVVLLGVAAVAVLVVGTLLAGLPQEPGRRALLLGCLGGGVLLFLVALSGRLRDPPLLAAALVGFGLSGAAMDLLQPSGPGFLTAYVAAAGLALRLPRRVALGTGVVVIGATAAAEAVTSPHPVSSILNLALGGGFLAFASAYAALSREASRRAVEQVAQEQATLAAREQAAVLAERSRLARELHDVLAHTLAGLAVQLEGARLLGEHTAADPRLVAQIAAAGRLTREGTANASRAVSALRGEALPGVDDLESLVAQARSTLGLAIDRQQGGSVQQITPEAGLCVYRTVQEALTNTAKYAGHGARAMVTVDYRDESLEVSVADAGGERHTVSSGSGGFGLAGLAERAALLGGSLESGPTPQGGRCSCGCRMPCRASTAPW